MCPNPDNSQLEKLQKGNIQVQFFVKKEEQKENQKNKSKLDQN